jgi:hypothetical protein
MNRARPGPWWYLPVMAALAFCLGERCASAQIAEDAEDQPLRIDGAPAADLIAHRNTQEAQRRRYKAAIEELRTQAFGGSAEAREHLERLVSQRIVELSLECELTEAQVRKLQLAGKGDVKRLTDRLDDLTHKLDDPVADMNELRNALVDWRTIEANWRTDLLGPGSIVSKTLAKTMSPEQVALRERVIADQRRLRYERAISVAVRSLQSNLGLNDRQSDRLARLLFKETRPPKKFGHASEIALVLCQTSGIPEEMLRPIFDDAQWHALNIWLAAYKAGAGGAKVLERNGFVFDDGRDHAPTHTGDGKTTPKREGRSIVATEGPMP